MLPNTERSEAPENVAAKYEERLQWTRGVPICCLYL